MMPSQYLYLSADLEGVQPDLERTQQSGNVRFQCLTPDFQLDHVQASTSTFALAHPRLGDAQFLGQFNLGQAAIFPGRAQSSKKLLVARAVSGFEHVSHGRPTIRIDAK